MSAATASAAQFEHDGYLISTARSPRMKSSVSGEIDRLIESKSTYVPERDLGVGAGTRIHRACERLPPAPVTTASFWNRQIQKGDWDLGGTAGHPLRLYGSQLFAKPALVGTQVPKHQDMPYWPFDPPELIRPGSRSTIPAWRTAACGFSAGSHKLGMLPHAPSNVKGNSLGLGGSPGRQTALPEHAVEVKARLGCAAHALTVHRSEPNRSSQSRRGLVYVYMSPNVKLTQPDGCKGRPFFRKLSDEVE